MTRPKAHPLITFLRAHGFTAAGLSFIEKKLEGLVLKDCKVHFKGPSWRTPAAPREVRLAVRWRLP